MLGWINRARVNGHYNSRGKAPRNGFVNHPNDKLWDEALSDGGVAAPEEARTLIERWRLDCNNVRLRLASSRLPLEMTRHDLRPCGCKFIRAADSPEDRKWISTRRALRMIEGLARFRAL
jgi:hypothetical protein